MTPCPICGGNTTLAFHSLRVSRGDRFVTVQAPHWECPTCPNSETRVPPFQMVDLAQMKEGESMVAQAWLTRYGEAIPAPKRPGRKPEDPKEERILLTLSKRELMELDAARGSTPRNVFIREAIAGQLGRRAS